MRTTDKCDGSEIVQNDEHKCIDEMYLCILHSPCSVHFWSLHSFVTAAVISWNTAHKGGQQTFSLMLSEKSSKTRTFFLKPCLCLSWRSVSQVYRGSVRTRKTLQYYIVKLRSRSGPSSGPEGPRSQD